MVTAYKYKRVSSKEQKEKKNSLPEQDRRIEQFAKEKNIKIVRDFEDSNSAFHDTDRKELDKMVRIAIEERPNYIILDDSSRLARTKKVAIEIKSLLRSYGIDILYASEPNVDASSTSGFWYEGIQEIKNEATSREIAFHTKKGMSGNLSQRDNETGWCYKNGGKAPFGYKRKVLYKGINEKGKPVYKTIWELDEINAEIMHMIIVDLYTTEEMSYKGIRDYLNKNNIKNSNGGVWSTTTIKSMLTEDRLEEYAGIGIWNKANNNIIGVKYNSRDKWVICENAHPAIITKEELENVLERKKKNKLVEYRYRSESDYLLSSTNIEDKFLFTCSECGGHVIGCSSGQKHIRKYKPESPNYIFEYNDFVFITVDGSKDVIPGTNGFYKESVLSWLEEQLNIYSDKNVIIFQHFPLIPPSNREAYYTFKPEKYLELLSRHKNVKAVISGHFGANSEKTVNGIVHISTAGLPYYRIIDIMDYETQNPVIWAELKEMK